MQNGLSVPDGEPLRDYYPAIIDEKTYYRAQGARTARNKRAAGRKGYMIANLVSGLCKCGKCGAPLLYVDKGLPSRPGAKRTSSSRYLVCTNARRDFDCDNRVHHHYEPFEALLLALLTMFDFSRLLEQPGGDEAKQVESLRGELAATKKRLAFLAGAGELSDTVRATIDLLIGREADLKKRLAKAEQAAAINAADSGRDYEEYRAMVERLQTSDLPDPDRYALRAKIAQELRRLIVEIVTVDRELVIRLRAPERPAEIRTHRSGLYIPGWEVWRLEEFRLPPDIEVLKPALDDQTALWGPFPAS
jgi:hypothetical protein